MAQIIQPEKKDRLGKIAGIASMLPGPVGAAGKAVTIGKALSENEEPQLVQAAQRRIGAQQTTPAPEPLQDLDAAYAAVLELPEDQQKEFLPPIMAARMKAMRGQV